MACRFMWDNKADYTTTTITANTASTELPVANVQHPHKGKVYTTTTVGASEWIKFDLGSAKAIDSFIVLNHDLTAADSSIKIQGNAADNWGAPSVDDTITYHAENLVHFFAATKTYQWWRFTFTKSAAGETRSIGRIFLGPYDEATRNIKYGSVKITPTDLSETDRALGGETYSEVLPIYHQVKGSFEWVADAQFTDIKTMVATCGTHTPFFVSLDPSTEPYDLTYYVKFAKLSAYKPEILRDGAYLWTTDVDMDEEV